MDTSSSRKTIEMNTSVNSLFEIQNTIYIFGRIFGGIFYSNITKLDIILNITRLLIYVTLAFMNFLFLNKYPSQHYFSTLMIASYILIFFCTIFIPVFFVHLFISRTKIFNIWYRLNHICTLINVNYDKFILIKKFLNSSLLGLLLYCALSCVFDAIFVPENIMFTFYSSFYTIIVLCLQFQIVAMLLVTRKICQKHNYELSNLYFRKLPREEIKKSLQIQFLIHHEIFNIYRNIEGLFMFFVFKYLFSFFNLGLNLLLFTLVIKNKWDKEHLFDALFWSIGDFVGMIYVISSAVIAKYEVFR